MRKVSVIAGFAIVMTIVTVDPMTPATAQSWVMPDRDFRVDWEQATKRRGTVLRGYIHNTAGSSATNIRLLVESLDARGQVVATNVGYVQGTIAPFDRLYYEVPIATPASSYRVRVGSWDLVGRGGA
jgi:hypothetical protein